MKVTSNLVSALVVAGAMAAFAAGACGRSDQLTPPVEPPPPPPPPPVITIGVSPTAIQFSDTAGTGNPAPLGIAVTNTGAGTATGVTVGTITYVPATASGWLSASVSGSDAPATVTLSASSNGLAPGSYSATVPIVSASAANSPQTVSVQFELSAAPPPPINGYVVVATGNMGDCGSSLASASARVVASLNPNYVFVLGDNAFPRSGRVATQADYQECYDPAWGQFRNITFAAVGDKDQDSATGLAAGFDAYFGAGRFGNPGENYYSMNIGSWHVVVLNAVSGGPERPVRYNNGSPQLNWLWSDLRANRGAKCTLALWHDPMWISSSDPPTATDPYPNHGYRDQPLRGIWIALYDNNADLVVNGGRHIYERFAPMRYDGTYEHPTEREFAADSVRGIRQISSGLAGDGPLSTPSVAVTHPLSQYRSGGNGVLKLTLGDGVYTWEFVNTANSRIQDSGFGTCH